MATRIVQGTARRFVHRTPSAPPSSLRRLASSSVPSDRQLTREEEQRERIKAMEQVMREKTMREVQAAAASRRPEGISHMLESKDSRSEESKAIDDAIAEEFGDAFAAADNAAGEWGGPKGKEPTRFGDWEQKGRTTDF